MSLVHASALLAARSRAAAMTRRRDAAASSSSIALNWKPEPEFGGLYEAQRIDAFAKHGLDVEITGGPGAPVVQMVAAGPGGPSASRAPTKW